MAYSCKVLADSMSPDGVRLTTLEVTFPRIGLAEMNTQPRDSGALALHRTALSPATSAAGFSTAKNFLTRRCSMADQPEMVNHPKHYTSHPSGIECVDIAEHLGFLMGNAYKYVWRAGLKGNKKEDIRKALWYLERFDAGESWTCQQIDPCVFSDALRDKLIAVMKASEPYSHLRTLTNWLLAPTDSGLAEIISQLKEAE